MKDKCSHYSLIKIPKRKGGVRTIHNPDTEIRVAQYRILRDILNKVKVPDYIHAFETGKSIPAMAVEHVGRDIILSFDLKDFFHSIKQVKVMAMFDRLGYTGTAAKTLSEICTYKAFVPQGAITSPKISNIIAGTSFGPVLKAYCDANDLTMTIYADDITISGNGLLDIADIKQMVQETVQACGLRLNFAKTKIMPKYVRQYVCGVVVNEKTNLMRRDRDNLKAIVHNIRKNGVEAEAAKNDTSGETFLSQLRGRLNWFRQLNPIKGGILFNLLAEYIQANKVEEDAAWAQYEAALFA